MENLAKHYRDIIVREDLIDKGTDQIFDRLDQLIPGSPISMYRSITDHFEIKKMATFLFCLRETTVQERATAIEKIENSETYASDVGATLMQILIRFWDLERPKVLGLIFKKVIKRRIKYPTFLRIAHILDSVFFKDLIKLTEFKHEQAVDNFILIPSPFDRPLLDMFEQRGITHHFGSNRGQGYELTEIGSVLREALTEIQN